MVALMRISVRWVSELHFDEIIAVRTVNIFDPGMIGYAGHHADINLRVAKEFELLGWRVVVYAHRDCSVKSPGMEIRTVFPLNPYSAIANYHLGLSVDSNVSLFTASVRSIKEQIELAGPSDLSLFPTLFPCQMTAIGQVRRNIGRVVGVLHFNPGWKNAFGEAYWRQGLRALQSFNGELMIGMLESELMLEYERLLESDKLRMHRLPTPYDGAAKLENPDRRFTVGILGHQRNEKRIDRLPFIVGALRDAGFSVLLQDSSGQISTSGADQELKVLGYVDNLADVIVACDVVVLDYDLDSYRFNGSGICSECFASGVPIIVPYGTSMSRLIDKYDSGLRFVSSDIGSLIRQVQDVKSRHSEWTRKAAKAKIKFNRENSTSLFVRAISDEVKS